MKEIPSSEIIERFRFGDFSILKISDIKFDIDDLRRRVTQAVELYGLVDKDGSKLYNGLSFHYSDPSNYYHDGISFIGNQKTSNDFRNVNEAGKMFSDVLNCFSDYGIETARTRILTAKPQYVHIWHSDREYRFHVPIWTNPHAILMFEEGNYHLPADGHLYIMNAFKEHNFCNMSNDSFRTHICGSLLTKKALRYSPYLSQTDKDKIQKRLKR